MRHRLTEESIMFASVLKWFVLATLTGAIVGLSTTVFLKALAWSINIAEGHKFFFLLLPVAFVISIVLIKWLAPDAEGHGTEKVIEAIHTKSGRIKAAVVPVKLVATIVTLACGGSAGKEGPCAQIGAGLASLFADLLRLSDHDRKKIVICGISAGFASVFGTPIAGSIFGVEVLFVGSMLYEVLLPSFIAGVTAYEISSTFGIPYFKHSVSVVPVFQEPFFIEVALKGVPVPWYAFAVKSVFTSITLNFGGSGGIVTPIFFIGAASGTLYAHLTGLDPATFAAIGLVAVLAGAANTPIAAAIMALEMFGPALGPYAAVACVISFLMTGHRSVYPSQILAAAKSPSLHVRLGEEVEGIQTEMEPAVMRRLAEWRRIVRRTRRPPPSV